MTATQDFLAARDLLLKHREDYDTAYRTFEWPKLDRFNWALDHFDVMARGNDRTALWIVETDGAEHRVSFAQMAERSNRAANFLRGLGVRRGDRVLLMAEPGAGLLVVHPPAALDAMVGWLHEAALGGGRS